MFLLLLHSNLSLSLCFSQAGDGDHPEQEEDGVCGEAVPGGVRERGLEAGGRRHLVQEQPLHGKDGFKGEFKLGVDKLRIFWNQPSNALNLF